jgi:hypothetical protein
VVPGIPIPAWFQSVTWADTSRERVWRAEEMELVTEPVVAVTGTMLTAIRSQMAVPSLSPSAIRSRMALAGTMNPAYRPRPCSLPEKTGPVEPAPTRGDSRALNLHRTLTRRPTNSSKINTRGTEGAPTTPVNDQS